jgi:hypothetical protein
MSKPEKPGAQSAEEGGFLSRWARRKAEARETPAEPEPGTAAEVPEEEDFDPAALPPVDSLTAESDFSLFLKKSVPASLRAAALRKLWLVEPSVVNYQPLVEYNWDFTAPGYGDLLPTDDVAKMLRTVFDGTREQVEIPTETPEGDVEQGADTPLALESSAEAPAIVEAAPGPPAEVGPAEVEAAPSVLPRRRHGGALPG